MTAQLSEQRSTERTIIRPGRVRTIPDLSEVWRYRELIKVLVERDIKVRYKQTVLGIAWAIVQPFFAMVVFTVVLHRGVGVASEPGIPYPIYTFAGLIVWQYFSEALQRSSRSLTSNNVLVTKIYFPRLVAPVSGILFPLLDLAIAFIVLVGMMIYYEFAVSWTIVLVIPLVVATLLTAAAFGIGLAAMNVEFRDVGQAVPVALQLWMFLTPVFYAASAVTGPLKAIDWVNPMSNILQAFRWSVIGTDPPDLWPSITSGAITLLVLVCMLRYFERMQRSFADAI